jgi:hypothetical protein
MTTPANTPTYTNVPAGMSRLKLNFDEGAGTSPGKTVYIKVPSGSKRVGMRWDEGHVSPPDGNTLPLFGVNSASWDDINTALGGIKTWRAYNTPGQSVPGHYPGTGTVPPNTIPIVSIKPNIPDLLAGKLDTALANYIKQIPHGSYFTAWHEGETNDGWTAPQIVACHAYMLSHVKANNAAVNYCQIFGNYFMQHSQGGPQWVGLGLPFYFMDGYGSSDKDDFDSIFAPTAKIIEGVAPGAKLGITEINHHTVGDRAAFFTNCYAGAKANNYVTFTPFYSTGQGIPWLTSDTASIAALTKINEDTKS